MKKIKAIFKGRDNSLGYRTGQQYELMICQDGEKIVIMREGHPEGDCVYDSTMLFFENWTDIQT